ncbi:MAG: hypothetical protein PHH13_01525 [Candidatus Peribacteraceae bacterium]|nr:hypothetical protein [Candidatus Peribacteraceae bacterium]
MASFRRFFFLSLAGALSVTCITVASARTMTGACPAGVKRCLLTKTVKTVKAEATDTSCKKMKGDRLRECQLSGKRPQTNATNNDILMRGRCSAKTAAERKECEQKMTGNAESIRQRVGKRFVQASQNALKTEVELKCKPLKTAAERIKCTQEVRTAFENNRTGE